MIIREAPMLVILIIVAALTTVASIAQIWLHYFDWETFGKIVISLGLFGTTTALVVAVEYDLPIAKKKGLLGAGLFLAVTLVVFIISQLWFAPVADTIFVKLIITNIILLGLVSIVTVMVEDFSSERSLRDEKYLS